MTYTKSEKAALNRKYRAKKAIAAGREPGRTGRPLFIGPLRIHNYNRNRKSDYEQQRKRRAVIASYRDGTNGTPIDPMTVPIYAEAKAIADSLTKRDGRRSVAEDLWDDLLCEAALALCEGVDAYAAAKAFKSKYYVVKNKWITGTTKDQFLLVADDPHQEVRF